MSRTEFAFGVLASIVAAVLVAAAKFGLQDWVRRHAEAARQRWRKPLRVIHARQGSAAVLKRLLAWLKSDQYRRGPRSGQLGTHQDIAETIRFDPHEMPRLKPRLYQTSWACFVLKRLNLLPDAVERARTAIERLMADGAVLAVMPAKRIEKIEQKVSIRHTVRAAHTLFVLDTTSRIARSVLQQMLDRGSRWQCSKGGWPQHFGARASADLWASVYAVDFLDCVLHVEPELSQQRGHIQQVLKTTVDHLSREWNRNRWAYQGASTAENAIHVLDCIAPTLRLCAPDLLASATGYADSWITSDDHVTAAYLRECEGVQLGSASARFAYFYFLMDPHGTRWRTLYSDAIEHFERGMDASDVAFLVELTLANQAPA